MVPSPKRIPKAIGKRIHFSRTAVISLLLLSLVAIFLLNLASAQSQQSLRCVQIGGAQWDNSSSQIFVRGGYPSHLNISGNIFVSGTGNGIVFPDGTRQTTASSGGGGGDGLPGLKYFTSSDSFTVPIGTTILWVTAWGGGGGGAGGAGANLGGGGGGGGEIILRKPLFVTQGQLIAVDIGAGGLGGPATVSGNDGWNTTVGTLIAHGGKKGISGGAGGNGGGNLGGAGGVGGSPGSKGATSAYTTGGSGGGGYSANGADADYLSGGTGCGIAACGGGGGGGGAAGFYDSGANAAIPSGSGGNAKANSGAGGAGGSVVQPGGNGGSGGAIVEWVQVSAPPSQVTSLSAANAGSKKISLSWPAPANNGAVITKYNIYRSTSSGAEIYLTNVGSAVTSYTDTGLTNLVTYYYRVSAVNAIGEGSQSAEVNAIPFTPHYNPTSLSNTNYVVIYNASTALTGDIIAYDITINPGVTVTTNGYNIYAWNSIMNQGTINTGTSGNRGISEYPCSYTNGISGPGGSGAYGLYLQANTISGGNINSIGDGITIATVDCGGGGGGGGVIILAYGSGGYTAGSYTVSGGVGTFPNHSGCPTTVAGGNGGSTLASGGSGGDYSAVPFGDGHPGTSPLTPTVTNTNIITWYTNGFQKYLGGGGGGSGCGGAISSGGNGGGAGGSNTQSYGGSGGGGGSQTDGTGAGGAGRGAAGGNGVAIPYQYTTQPITLTTPTDIGI